MSWLTHKSKILLVAAALLGGLTFIQPASFDPNADLPSLAEVKRADVTRIEITTGQDETVVMEGSLDEGFNVLAPYQAPADTIALRPLLALFERGKTRMDVAVDTGNLADYGLDDAQGVLVELFTDSDEPAVSFVVGQDRPGGASFVRLPGSDVVYRGKVGSRARYARPALEWRDKMVTQLPAGLVQEIRIEPLDGAKTVFERLPEGDIASEASAKFGNWSSTQADFPVDQKSIDALAKTLTELRAGRVLSPDFDGGFEPPAVVVKVLMVDGEQITLTIGQRTAEGGAVFLKRSGRDEVYLVSGSLRDRLLRPILAYRNRILFNFERLDVRDYILEDDLGRAVLTQNSATNMWAFTEPVNMDTDVLAVTQSVNTLGDLRADAIDPEMNQQDAGLMENPSSLTVRMKDGSTQTLLIGHRRDLNGTVYTYVTRPELLPNIYLVRTETLTHMRAGFNRSE